MKRAKTKGFTLIELIVVIAIIAVLSSILIPVITNYVAKSKIASRNADAKQFYTNIVDLVDDLNRENYTINGVSSGQGNTADITSINISPTYVGSDLQQRFNKVPENFVLNGVNWAYYIENNEIKTVVTADRNMNYGGGFPNPCPPKQTHMLDSVSNVEDLLIYALKPGDKMNGVEAKNWSKKN